MKSKLTGGFDAPCFINAGKENKTAASKPNRLTGSRMGGDDEHVCFTISSANLLDQEGWTHRHLPAISDTEHRRRLGSMDFQVQYGSSRSRKAAILSRQTGDRIVISWDTAMSSKELSSYSACLVLQVKDETAFARRYPRSP